MVSSWFHLTLHYVRGSQWRFYSNPFFLPHRNKFKHTTVFDFRFSGWVDWPSLVLLRTQLCLLMANDDLIKSCIVCEVTDPEMFKTALVLKLFLLDVLHCHYFKNSQNTVLWQYRVTPERKCTFMDVGLILKQGRARTASLCLLQIPEIYTSKPSVHRNGATARGSIILRVTKTGAIHKLFRVIPIKIPMCALLEDMIRWQPFWERREEKCHRKEKVKMYFATCLLHSTG